MQLVLFEVLWVGAILVLVWYASRKARREVQE